jgi:glycine cleavage system regulatory protein
MLSLLKSKKFQNEYNQYQDKIEKITDLSTRNQAMTLLKTLAAEVKNLDSQHQDMFSGNQIPMGLGDARSNIVAVRKQLEKICKDWNSSKI